jgi:hypothetical protein
VPRIFLTQALVISEWIARYPGPWERYWYLTDGGFFENLGGYELIRRRVPRIIVSDAAEDASFEFGTLANLVRKARIDFCAQMTPFTLADINLYVPLPLRALIGSIEEMKPNAAGTPSVKQGALFWVDYDNYPGTRSVLLYLKAKLTGKESADIVNYHATHPEFPNESTVDQFFDEDQWESYRQLGEQLGSASFADPDWFWKISLDPNATSNPTQT